MIENIIMTQAHKSTTVARLVARYTCQIILFSSRNLFSSKLLKFWYTASTQYSSLDQTLKQTKRYPEIILDFDLKLSERSKDQSNLIQGLYDDACVTWTEFSK